MQSIHATVWGENIHERKVKTVSEIYPRGIHGCIAEALNASDAITATPASLQEPDQGLSAECLRRTDVLLWWGHCAHGDVAEETVARVLEAVHGGMGFIALHSSHFAKPFRRLMGTPCSLRWREAGERERIWITAPHHPIVRGIPPCFELEQEEMYGEPFSIPEPLQTVMIGWFQGGEVFRTGVTYTRGAGKVFYFQPGHEMYPTYHNALVQRILINAVHWAFNPEARLTAVNDAPNVPANAALEPLEARGPRLHNPGERGFS